MLNKLLKYDLKYIIKNMSVFYILSIFFAVFTRIFFSLEESIMIKIVSQITVGCLFAMIANIFINTMMRSWVRFRTSIYRDEAYLTHTLPVTKDDIYNSKFIETLIFFIVGFVIILISLFIAYYSKDNWMAISNYIKTITTGLNMSTLFFVTAFFIIVFLEVFNAIQCGFFGIILGYRSYNNRIALSVLFGFIAYLVSQSLVLLSVFIYGFFDSSVMELFKTATINIDAGAFKTLAIIAAILYIIIITIMNIICRKLLNRGVNIE